MALSQADKDYIAQAIVAGIATALNEIARPAAAAPKAKAEAASPLVKAPKGKRMAATRAANLKDEVPGKHCPDCAIGFVFEKVTCPKCGEDL